MIRILRKRSAVTGLLAGLFAWAGASIGSAQELANPSSNLEVVKAGSLIIAMDNDKQNVGSLFNVASYGLVVDLLNNNIPVKWAIRAGKAKDAIDFTATAERFAPSAQAQATLGFAGGPFIVEESYATLARARISSFGRNVVVYELKQDATIDIRYNLLFKPRPFVNTTNASIITNLLVNAGISTYTVGPDFTLQNSSCYTIIMEPHNDVITGINAISSFVSTGGNFYAQCLSVTSFENAIGGKFLSTTGITEANVNTGLTYPNPDLSFSQLIGAVDPNPGGALMDWLLSAGSIFKSGTTSHAESGTGASLRYAAMQGKTIAGQGGVVFYVGGHNYSGTALGDLNGQRLMFNAILTPAKRPDVCNVQPLEIPVSDITISKTHSGAYMSGTQGVYSFTVSNIGNRASVDDIVVTDTLPAGLTFVSGSGSGWTFTSAVAGGRTIVTATYSPSMLVGGSTTFSINVGIGAGAIGTRANTAHVVGGGEVNLANNSASVSVQVVGMSGQVFEDLNTVGQWDANDPGFAGVNVTVVNNSVTYATTTDANGFWTVAGLFPGTNATVTIGTAGPNAFLAGATQSVGTDPSTHAVGSSGTSDGGKDGFRDLVVNLTVAKSGPATALVSDTIEYVLTTSNAGPNAALLTVVTDTLPALATLVYASRGATLTGNVLTWPPLTVPVGSTVRDTVRVRAPPDTSTLLNIAAATTARLDPNPADNNGSQSAARVSTVLTIPDLTITKSHTGDFTVGANGTYTVTLSNTGTGPALSAVVTDTLPAGLSYISAAAVSGSWSFSASGQVVTATLTSSLAAAGSASFTLTVQPGAAAVPSVTNVARVAGLRETALANNSSSDLTNVRVADLTVIKTSPPFTQGSNGDYKLTVKNVGTGATTGNIVVRDSLANGLTYVSGQSVVGSWSFTSSGQIVTATYTASLAVNDSATFTITVLPGPAAYPSVNNIAVVSGGAQLNLANDTTWLTTSLAGSADLTLSKSAAPVPFVYGSNGTYTITVNNIGAVPTTGAIVVTDTLPAGLTFVSGTGTSWAFASSVIAGGRTLVTATYSGAALAALNGTTNFSITVNVLAATANVTNTGWVSGGGDGFPNNNSGSVTTAITAGSDLTVVKQSPASFTEGVNGTYTIVVRNVGAASTSGTITVRDTLPAGVSFVSRAAVVGSWSFAQTGNAVTATTTGVLQPNDSASFSITVTPLPAGVPSVTNKAVVSNPSQVNLANDTSYVTTPVGGLVDLNIAKTSSAFSEYTEGTYTITVGNIGSVPSTGAITVIDTLVAGISFVSGAGSGWSFSSSGQVVTATYTGSIAVNGSAPFTLTVMVGDVAASVVNRARVSGGGDSNSANNLATVTTTVVQKPDLTVAKTSSTFTVGQTNATYTLTVTNIGSVNTSAPMILVDTLPAGLTLVSIGSGWTGSYDTGTRVVTATRTNTLNDGSSTSLVLTVSVAASALPSVSNTAWVSGGGEVNTANNSGGVTTPVLVADVTLSKTSIATFSVGLNDKGYRFIVTNSGNGAIPAGTTITVVDTLPVGVTAVAKDGSGDWTLAYDAGTRVMTATHTKALAVGESTQTLQIDVTFAASTAPSVTNTAYVSTAVEVNTANNSSSVTTPVNGTDLSLAKTSSALFTPGTTGTYTLTVTNVGTTATSGTYTVVDTLPANLTLASVTTPQNGWTLGVVTVSGRAIVTATRSTALAAAASTSFTVNPTVLVAAMPSVYNKAYVSGGGQLDSPANDTASIVTPVASPDLTLGKAAAGAFDVGSTAGYTLTVQNVGTYVSSGTITVTDTLPAGLSYHAAGTSGSGWSFSNNGQVVTATFTGTLAASASTSFTIGVSIGEAAAPNVTNVARVSGGNDQNPGNNTGGPITTLVGGQSDLTVTKTATTANFTYGATGSYTIQVSNTGTLSTSGTITVRDTLAAGLTFVSGSGTNWTVSEAGGVVTATNPGPIATGASSTFTLNVTVGVAAASVANVARVSGGGQTNLSNDSSRVVTPIIAPDLTLAKVANGVFQTGSNATYDFTVTNVGDASTSGNIVVTDTLPTGLTYVSGSGTNWAFSATGQVVTATYAGPALAIANGSATFTLTVAVGSAALPQVQNSGYVSGGGEYNTSNDKAGPITTPVGGQSDLIVAKAATGSFQRGSNATYTFTVTNIGNIATTGSIVVTDTLTADLAYVSGSGTGWAFGVAGQVVTATYTGSALAATNGSTSFTLTVAISVNAGASVTNAAWVSGGGELNVSNDGSGPVTTPLGGAPNITLVKSVLPAANVVPGTVLTYTLTFLNGGNAPAVNVIVTDDLPSQLEFKLGSIVTTYPSGITGVTEYYNGTTWTYTPVSGGCGAPAGYDGCVTKVRWSLQSPMPQTEQGVVSLQARVK